MWVTPQMEKAAHDAVGASVHARGNDHDPHHRPPEAPPCVCKLGPSSVRVRSESRGLVVCTGASGRCQAPTIAPSPRACQGCRTNVGHVLAHSVLTPLSRQG